MPEMFASTEARYTADACHINLKGLQLTKLDLSSIDAKAATTMDLRGNVLTREALNALADAVVTNTALDELNLSCVPLDGGHAKAVERILRNTSVRKLCLNGCRLVDEGITEIAHGGLLMSRCDKLELELSYNAITDAGAISLFQALARADNVHLHKLHLSHNPLSDKCIDALVILVRRKDACKTLKQIKLVGTYITTAAATRVLAAAPPGTQVQHDKAEGRIESEAELYKELGLVRPKRKRRKSKGAKPKSARTPRGTPRGTPRATPRTTTGTAGSSTPGRSKGKSKGTKGKPTRKDGAATPRSRTPRSRHVRSLSATTPASATASPVPVSPLARFAAAAAGANGGPASSGKSKVTTPRSKKKGKAKKKTKSQVQRVQGLRSGSQSAPASPSLNRRRSVRTEQDTKEKTMCFLNRLTTALESTDINGGTPGRLTDRASLDVQPLILDAAPAAAVGTPTQQQSAYMPNGSAPAVTHGVDSMVNAQPLFMATTAAAPGVASAVPAGLAGLPPVTSTPPRRRRDMQSFLVRRPSIDVADESNDEGEDTTGANEGVVGEQEKTLVDTPSLRNLIEKSKKRAPISFLAFGRSPAKPEAAPAQDDSHEEEDMEGDAEAEAGEVEAHSPTDASQFPTALNVHTTTAPYDNCTDEDEDDDGDEDDAYATASEDGFSDDEAERLAATFAGDSAAEADVPRRRHARRSHILRLPKPAPKDEPLPANAEMTPLMRDRLDKLETEKRMCEWPPASVRQWVHYRAQLPEHSLNFQHMTGHALCALTLEMALALDIPRAKATDLLQRIAAVTGNDTNARRMSLVSDDGVESESDVDSEAEEEPEAIRTVELAAPRLGSGRSEDARAIDDDTFFAEQVRRRSDPKMLPPVETSPFDAYEQLGVLADLAEDGLVVKVKERATGTVYVMKIVRHYLKHCHERDMLREATNERFVVALHGTVCEPLCQKYALLLEPGTITLDYFIGRSVPARDIKQALNALVESLSYLHSLNLVHFDVKPANVLYCAPDNGMPLWKLIDLEHTRRAGTRLAGHELAFTEKYCPPELAASMLTWLELHSAAPHYEVSPAQDVWAVGLVMLDVIGARPFRDISGPRSMLPHLAALRDGWWEPLVENLSMADRSVRNFLRKTLAVRPEDRASMAVLCEHAYFVGGMTDTQSAEERARLQREASQNQAAMMMDTLAEKIQSMNAESMSELLRETAALKAQLIATDVAFVVDVQECDALAREEVLQRLAVKKALQRKLRKQAKVGIFSDAGAYVSDAQIELAMRNFSEGYGSESDVSDSDSEDESDGDDDTGSIRRINTDDSFFDVKDDGAENTSNHGKGGSGKGKSKGKNKGKSKCKSKSKGKGLWNKLAFWRQKHKDKPPEWRSVPVKSDRSFCVRAAFRKRLVVRIINRSDRGIVVDNIDMEIGNLRCTSRDCYKDKDDHIDVQLEQGGRTKKNVWRADGEFRYWQAPGGEQMFETKCKDSHRVYATLFIKADVRDCDEPLVLEQEIAFKVYEREKNLGYKRTKQRLKNAWENTPDWAKNVLETACNMGLFFGLKPFVFVAPRINVPRGGGGLLG